MIVSMNWLKEYVEIDCPIDEYTERMNMTGNNVEGICKNTAVEGVVLVGKIISKEKHLMRTNSVFAKWISEKEG